MCDDERAQLDPNDALGWLVDMAEQQRTGLCPKAVARAKQALRVLRDELREARQSAAMCCQRPPCGDCEGCAIAEEVFGADTEE